VEEAQIQVGEITLTNFFLAAGIGESEEGIEETHIELHFDSDICTQGTVGCSAELTTRDDVLRINGFSSATLSPVTLEICVALDEFGECAETLPVTLQAKFKGFGRVEAGNLFIPEPGSDSGHPPFLVHVHGNTRDAIATGSLNGQDLGQSTEAIIFRNIIF
jgi:hypothetical protein